MRLGFEEYEGRVKGWNEDTQRKYMQWDESNGGKWSRESWVRKELSGKR